MKFYGEQIVNEEKRIWWVAFRGGDVVIVRADSDDEIKTKALAVDPDCGCFDAHPIKALPIPEQYFDRKMTRDEALAMVEEVDKLALHVARNNGQVILNGD
jgi:hypothetical protein